MFTLYLKLKNFLNIFFFKYWSFILYFSLPTIFAISIYNFDIVVSFVNEYNFLIKSFTAENLIQKSSVIHDPLIIVQTPQADLENSSNLLVDSLQIHVSKSKSEIEEKTDNYSSEIEEKTDNYSSEIEEKTDNYSSEIEEKRLNNILDAVDLEFSEYLDRKRNEEFQQFLDLELNKKNEAFQETFSDLLPRNNDPDLYSTADTKDSSMLMHMQNLENAKLFYELASAGDKPNEETKVLAFLILNKANQHFETWKEVNSEFADVVKDWEEEQEQERLDRILNDVDEDFVKDVNKPEL